MKETLYKKEPRSYLYRAESTSRRVSFRIQMSFFDDGNKYTIPFDIDFNETIINHNHKIPEVGLYPKHEKFVKLNKVLSGKYDQMAIKISDILKKNWSAKYSEETLPHVRSQGVEISFRCNLLEKNQRYIKHG